MPGQKPTKLKQIKLGGVKTNTFFQPDINAVLKKYKIDWKGPYSTDCLPCKSIVDQLNALPGWVVRADMQLQRAEALLKYSELIKKANKVSLSFLKYKHPDKTDYSGLPAMIAKLKAELLAFKKLFEKLIKAKGECEAKYCPDNKAEDASYLPVVGGILINNCPDPVADEAINVGANSEVGSSANFKEKAKNKATGLATKAITSLLGIGGGGGGKSVGPGTYKDPVKDRHKSKIKNKADKREIRLGGVFTPEGLLISTDIKKAPGKGTFQTAYLENQRGWRLMPIALYMYEIWADWKLSVSWTRDTYVDGEHVKHEQGGWTENWRELIASGQEVLYGEVPSAPFWQQLGFNTAVSGARSLGTLFPVSPEMLANEPVNLVIHITDPKKDPVITVPYILELSLDNKGRVVIEEVEQTTVAGRTVCTEPRPVIAATTPIANTIDDAIDDEVKGVNNDGQTAPQNCPEGWICRPGKSCPPIENCTIGDGTDQPVGTTTQGESPVSSSPDDEIEEIDVTGSRIRYLPEDTVVITPTSNTPVTNETGEDELEEIEVTGSRIKRPPNDVPITIPLDETPPTDNKPVTTDSSSNELEEVEVTGTRHESTTVRDYELGLKGNFSTGVRLGVGLRYDYEDTYTSNPPPTIYGEELDPPIVGIVLKNFDRYWVPRYKDYTFVTAKMYVPGPGGTSWIPHDKVSRRMEITFVGRSKEKGKAMNADLPAGPQDSPDLYFDPVRNSGVECRDDPTGKGHFGTCKTISPHNEYLFAINSDDYGGFSRLDVSCEGCVQLTLVAGMFPETFTRHQRWELALPEPDQEKRAVYVPHDVNKNQVSDGYAPDKISHHSADEDSENTPAGNGVNGDGLSAYEEYRGFIDLNGRHRRTDWDKKTLLIENSNRLNIAQFGTASGLDVLALEIDGHKARIVNFNSGHANVVDQHGLILKMFPSLDDKYGGYCFCDLQRPKGAEKVTVKPAYRNTDTVAHELGHAVGMAHHGNVGWPEEESIRFMTGGIQDLLPGRVNSNPMLCGKTLPATFKVGTKGDQGSGNHRCIMKYGHYHYVYEQAGGDYDCMPSTPRSIFDDSPHRYRPEWL